MRALLIILGIAALVAVVTPLLATVTGDLASAVMLELMVFITVASLSAGAPRTSPQSERIRG